MLKWSYFNSAKNVQMWLVNVHSMIVLASDDIASDRNNTATIYPKQMQS